MKYHVFDTEEDSNVLFEKFNKRKQHKKPSNSLSALERTTMPDGDIKFEETGLQTLYEDGYITDVIRMVRRGKEATVYLCCRDDELFAAKVYTDLQVRSFRNDTVYRDGRFIGSKRMEKAIEQHSRTGINAHQALWIAEEFRQLRFLHENAISVPKPIATSGRVILMEFIGDEDSEAPRISEAQLNYGNLKKAFAQSLDNLIRMVKVGRIHGDYSTFNLLWWENRVVVIDLPQVVEIQRNHNARDLLKRDVESLCNSFIRLGIICNTSQILREVESYADWRK